MPWSYLGLNALLVVTGVLLTVAAGRKRPRVAKAVAAFVVLVLLPLQALHLDRPWVLANATGATDLIFVSYQYVFFAGVLTTAGLLALEQRTQRIRAGVLGGVLLTVAFVATPRFSPDLTTLGKPYADCNGVVWQTAPSSCGAAAAATLLRTKKIDLAATEARLAQHCLTDPRSGTSELGLFRGLNLLAPGRDVRFAHPNLKELRGPGTPCIAFVGLERSRVEHEELYLFLRDACNWREGEQHAVVCFGFEKGKPPHEEPEVALIGDPRFGLERWPMSHFNALWSGVTLEVR